MLRRPAIVGVAAMAALSIAAIIEAFAPTAPLASVLATAALVGISLAVLADIAIARPLVAELERERRRAATIDAELRLAQARRGFAEQLDRAIEMADSDDEVLDLVGRALTLAFPDRDNFVLLAPSGEPRVTWSIPADADGLGVPELVGEPMRCSALGSSTTAVTDTSTELDACAHLATHGCDVSSMCVPVLVDDRHLAVAHSAGPAGDPVDDEGRRLVEMVARRAGARLATLRAARGAQDTVTADPLTGVAAHTSGQRQVRELIGAGTTFAVAVCDLDAFAAYNHAHGTDAGDHAVRLYAEVLGATLRPTDSVVRLPGDRFLCLFPHCERANARAAMERVREALVLTLALDERPPFTASVAVLDGTDATTLEELMAVAQNALDDAKDAGGNRVVVDGRDAIRLDDAPR